MNSEEPEIKRLRMKEAVLESSFSLEMEAQVVWNSWKANRLLLYSWHRVAYSRWYDHDEYLGRSTYPDE
jgi:hypothetical protein